jgi:hypothetical protein
MLRRRRTGSLQVAQLLITRLTDLGHAAQWGQVKKKSLKEKPKGTGRSEGAASGTRGRGRGGTERGVPERGRGRGGISMLGTCTYSLEGRGTRGRGRGETRGRGRGTLPASSDATSNAATIGSEETPATWGDIPSMEDVTLADTETTSINGINGTTTYDETPVAAIWTSPTADDYQSTTMTNGAAAQKPPLSSTPTPRQSRIVDPTAKFSWASIVKPAAPPPAPKAALPPKSTVPPLPQEPPVPQTTSRPSTRGQDVAEEPAQTIHDPFSTAEPSKPKVQLPQPALPYIPSIVSQPKEQIPIPAEPLTSRNLDLLEDQQSPVPNPPTPGVGAPRASPASKSEGPPGLSTRFTRASRDNPVVMPGMPSQPLSGIQLQFGYNLYRTLLMK